MTPFEQTIPGDGVPESPRRQLELKLAEWRADLAAAQLLLRNTEQQRAGMQRALREARRLPAGRARTRAERAALASMTVINTSLKKMVGGVANMRRAIASGEALLAKAIDEGAAT